MEHNKETCQIKGCGICDTRVNELLSPNPQKTCEHNNLPHCFNANHGQHEACCYCGVKNCVNCPQEPSKGWDSIWEGIEEILTDKIHHDNAFLRDCFDDKLNACSVIPRLKSFIKESFTQELRREKEKYIETFMNLLNSYQVELRVGEQRVILRKNLFKMLLDEELNK